MTATRYEVKRDLDWLRRVAIALVRDSDEAEDLVQETLIVAMHRGPGPSKPARPWLRGVLRNVLMHHRRAKGRRSAYESAAATEANVPRPDELLETLQAERTLNRALELLNEPARTTVMLHYYRGMTSAEIARQLALPSSTVRSRLAIGLDRLREALEPPRAVRHQDARNAGPEARGRRSTDRPSVPE